MQVSELIYYLQTLPPETEIYSLFECNACYSTWTEYRIMTQEFLEFYQGKPDHPQDYMRKHSLHIGDRD